MSKELNWIAHINPRTRAVVGVTHEGEARTFPGCLPVPMGTDPQYGVGAIIPAEAPAEPEKAPAPVKAAKPAKGTKA